MNVSRSLRRRATLPLIVVAIFSTGCAGSSELRGGHAPNPSTQGGAEARAQSPTPAIPPQAPSSPSATPNSAAAAPVDAPRSAPPNAPATLHAKAFPLPGASGAVSLDYIAYEPANARVWVPAGNTGSVAVFDTMANTFAHVDGFKTLEQENNGKKRGLGPSSVTIGDGAVYIGNRASWDVCVTLPRGLTMGKCIHLSAPPDGVLYVAAVKEVWVTTPKTDSIVVLDATLPEALKIKTTLKLPGAPEGYAIDNQGGTFYTNLEDKDRTLAIDARTHKVKSTWEPQCGEAGPRGLAVDPAHSMLFVACTDHIQSMDIAHDGALVGKLNSGAGVDNIDFLATHRLLYVAAGKAATLTVARVDEKGQFEIVASGQTSPGARTVVADASGNAYVADGATGRLLLFPFSP